LTQKYDQEVGYTKIIHAYSAMMNVTRIIATPINSNKFADFDLKK